MSDPGLSRMRIRVGFSTEQPNKHSIIAAIDGEPMGNLTKKVKKKKSRQAKAKFTSLVTIATTVAFLNAASSVYLREIYNIKTLLPSWGLSKQDVVFKVGDLMILRKELALKILVDLNLLVTEQVRQVAMLALVGAAVYMIGKKWSERMALFLFVVGMWGVLYYAFLYAIIKWPSSLLAKDVLALVPLPVIVPVYMPLLLSAMTCVGGLFLILKSK